MFGYIFEYYKGKVYINGNKKVKDFSFAEKLYLFLVFICAICIFVFAITEHTIAMGVSILIISLVMIVFAIRENKFREEENVERLKKYKKNKISKLVNYLKQKDVDLYDKKSIVWLMEMCDEYEANNKAKNWFDPVKSYFILIIYPILTAVAAIVVKELSTDEVIQIAAIIIAVLVEIFIIGCAAYPEIQSLLNRDCRLVKIFKDDLRYILLQLEKEVEIRK